MPMDRPVPVLDDNPLRRRLAEPCRRLDLAGAASCWHHARVVVRCAGGGALARDGRMASRLRGALGRQLADSASADARAGRPCPWEPPCALDVLFGAHGKAAGGLEIPKPYVVAVAEEGGDLLAGLTLFGFAADLAEAAAEALVRGLRHGLNQGEADHARYRPLEVAGRWISTEDRVEVPEAPPGSILLLEMETPLAIRDGDAVKAPDFGDLVSSLTARVQGLARWQDSGLEADWRALVAEGRGLRRHAVAGGGEERWRRGSTRQNRGFTVGGATAQWLVDTPSADLLRLLALGTTTGAGGGPRWASGVSACVSCLRVVEGTRGVLMAARSPGQDWVEALPATRSDSPGSIPMAWQYLR